MSETMQHTVGDAVDVGGIVRVQKSRAASLRRMAEHLDGVTATAFRRRAAELEMASWSVAARAGDRRSIDRHVAAAGRRTAAPRRSHRAAA
jgi:hypothetical protein